MPTLSLSFLMMQVLKFFLRRPFSLIGQKFWYIRDRLNLIVFSFDLNGMFSRFIFLVLLAGGLGASERIKRSLNGAKALHMEISQDNQLIKYPFAIDYPYMIELLTTGGHLCGGGLIKPNFALTAKHCLPKNIEDFTDVSRYKLIAGNQIYEDKNSSFVQVRTVEKICKHPGQKVDLAILKVIEPFNLDIHVNVAKLPPQTTENIYRKKMVVALGWGWTKEKRHSDYLLKVYGSVVSMDVGHKIEIKGMFGGFPQGGDSGGPVVVQGEKRADDVLIGIIHSIGQQPFWYAENLAHFADWIKGKIAIM